MSYAQGQTKRGRDNIVVGSKAGKDVILAQSSYDASQILLRAAKHRHGSRLKYIRRSMRYYGPGSGALFDKERQVLLRRGWAPNQATYDAMRLVASNSYTREGLQAIRAAMSETYGADYGMGGITKKGRKIGCGITGGVTMVGGLVASIYGGEGGGAAVGAGGSTVAGALDCGRESRESQERIAAANAAAAQSVADAALLAAQSEERTQSLRATERTKQIKTVAVIGGGLALLLMTGYAIVKV